MGEPKTILCVDDEAPVLLMQRMMLESARFRVLTASSGAEAVHKFAAEHVDLVVMDYLMPGMNGTAAASIMKYIKPDVPIIFLSAYSELPGETLGIANRWVKKGEQEPEQFIAELQSLLEDSPQCRPKAS